MSDPTRWRDDPTGLTAGVGVLLRGTRRPQAPGAHELERLGAAVDGISRRPIPASGPRLAVAGIVASVVAGGGTFGWALHMRNEQRRAVAAAETDRAAREAPPARQHKVAVVAPAAPAPAPVPARVRRHVVAEPRVAVAPTPEPVSPND